MIRQKIGECLIDKNGLPLEVQDQAEIKHPVKHAGQHWGVNQHLAQALDLGWFRFFSRKEPGRQFFFTHIHLFQLAGPAKRGFYPGHDLRSFERLSYIIVSAQLERKLLTLVSGFSGKNDNGQICKLQILPDLFY